jgi:hypothetical protein
MRYRLCLFADRCVVIQHPKQSGREIAYRVGIAVSICLIGLILICVVSLLSEGGLWLLLLLVPSIVAPIVFYSRVQKLVQKRRDDFALTVFDEARAGNVGKFALFLRPFYVTGKLHLQVMVPTTVNPANYSTQTYTVLDYKLEETIISGFKKLMPIVALGKPGEVQGVGRILMSENTWKDAASELLRHSSLILCIPSSHPGTVWELDEIIRNGYLSKAVFLMPSDPSDPSKKFFSKKWKTMIDDWNLAAAHMRSHGLVIPEYREDGLLFAVKSPVGCFIEKLDLSSPRHLRKAILRLSSPLPPSKRWEQKTPKRGLLARAMASISRHLPA